LSNIDFFRNLAQKRELFKQKTRIKLYLIAQIGVSFVLHFVGQKNWQKSFCKTENYCLVLFAQLPNVIL